MKSRKTTQPAELTLEDLASTPQGISNCFVNPVINDVEVGKAYFAFTNTFAFIGTCINVDSFSIEFSDTVWVSHSGFMHKMAATGKLSIAVPMKAKSFIPWTSIINLMEWNFPVPTVAVDE